MARKTGSHSEITGPKVRDAALKLIARQGYAAVSMRQIAAQVGVQVGALYNYTADKQSLLFELLHGHMDQLLAARKAVEKSVNVEAQLREFTEFHIRFHLERPEQVFIAYMELRNLTPENFAIIENLRRTYEDELEEILRSGQQTGAFQIEDTKITVMALIAMLTGAANWYDEAGRLSKDELIAVYWKMVQRSVGLIRN